MRKFFSRLSGSSSKDKPLPTPPEKPLPDVDSVPYNDESPHLNSMPGSFPTGPRATGARTGGSAVKALTARWEAMTTGSSADAKPSAAVPPSGSPAQSPQPNGSAPQSSTSPATAAAEAEGNDTEKGQASGAGTAGAAQPTNTKEVRRRSTAPPSAAANMSSGGIRKAAGRGTRGEASGSSGRTMVGSESDKEGPDGGKGGGAKGREGKQVAFVSPAGTPDSASLLSSLSHAPIGCSFPLTRPTISSSAKRIPAHPSAPPRPGSSLSGSMSHNAAQSPSVSSRGGPGTKGDKDKDGRPTVSRPTSSPSAQASTLVTSGPYPLSGPGPISTHSLTLHLSHSHGDEFSHLPNSIPFASSSLRSSSPLSFQSAGGGAASAGAIPGSGMGSTAVGGPRWISPSLGAAVAVVHSSSQYQNQEQHYQQRQQSGDPQINSNGVRFASGAPLNESLGSASTSSPTNIGSWSWSEMTEEDLVMHLGPRERTRQEVLWEIVASEERYVGELEKAKELYIDPLLHPLRFSPPNSPIPSGPEPGFPSSSAHQVSSSGGSDGQPAESLDHLPIAARFLTSSALSASPNMYRPDSSASSREGESAEAEGHMSTIRDPAYAAQGGGKGGRGVANNLINGKRESRDRGFFSGLGITRASPNMSSVSLSSQKKQQQPAPTPSQSTATPPPSSTPPHGVRSKLHKRRSVSSGHQHTPSDLNHSLSPPLREVLEVLSSGLVEGHALLSEGLKRRYEEQWPLVRSLADIFLEHADILKSYNTYVLGLEAALREVDAAVEAARGGKKKRGELEERQKLGRVIMMLEARASERGECGLAIFLSKPFQRLLKYPLLFQNLLFHTDPSTYEFESTVAMVAEVERIVRSIEDEKMNADERDKTRDAFARIEGLKDKRLMAPLTTRLLLEERPLYEDSRPRRAVSDGLPNETSNTPRRSQPTVLHGTNSMMKDKRSFRRLSDFLQSEGGNGPPAMGSKRDLWLVRFNDVELRCQRVGITALPMASTSGVKGGEGGQGAEGADALAAPDLTTKERKKESKDKLKALRNKTLKSRTRNLYKFLAIEAWTLQDSDGRPGLTSMEDIARSRSGANGTILQSPAEEEESESDDDGVVAGDGWTRQRHSKMSFSYGGHDKIEPRQPPFDPAALVPSRSPANASAGGPHTRPPGATRPRSNSKDARDFGPGIRDRTSTGPTSSASPPPAATAAATAAHARRQQDKFAGRLRSEVGSGPEVLRGASRQSSTSTGGGGAGPRAPSRATTATTATMTTTDGAASLVVGDASSVAPDSATTASVRSTALSLAPSTMSTATGASQRTAGTIKGRRMSSPNVQAARTALRSPGPGPADAPSPARVQPPWL